MLYLSNIVLKQFLGRSWFCLKVLKVFELERCTNVHVCETELSYTYYNEMPLWQYTKQCQGWPTCRVPNTSVHPHWRQIIKWLDQVLIYLNISSLHRPFRLLNKIICFIVSKYMEIGTGKWNFEHRCNVLTRRLRPYISPRYNGLLIKLQWHDWMVFSHDICSICVRWIVYCISRKNSAFFHIFTFICVENINHYVLFQM